MTVETINRGDYVLCAKPWPERDSWTLKAGYIVDEKNAKVKVKYIVPEPYTLDGEQKEYIYNIINIDEVTLITEEEAFLHAMAE